MDVEAVGSGIAGIGLVTLAVNQARGRDEAFHCSHAAVLAMAAISNRAVTASQRPDREARIAP